MVFHLWERLLLAQTRSFHKVIFHISDSAQKFKLTNGGGPPNDYKKKSVTTFKKSVSAPQPLPVSTLPKINVDLSVPHDVWLCLRCAGQSCSPRSTPAVPETVSHAMQHYETPRWCLVNDIFSDDYSRGQNTALVRYTNTVGIWIAESSE